MSVPTPKIDEADPLTVMAFIVALTARSRLPLPRPLSVRTSAPLAGTAPAALSFSVPARTDVVPV